MHQHDCTYLFSSFFLFIWCTLNTYIKFLLTAKAALDVLIPQMHIFGDEEGEGEDHQDVAVNI